MRTLYVGMDIHKNFIQAAAMDQAGTIIKEQQFNSTEKEIKRFIKTLKAQNIQAAIEADLHLVSCLRNTGCSWRQDNPREHETDENNRGIQDKNR